MTPLRVPAHIAARARSVLRRVEKAAGKKRVPGDGDGDGIPNEGRRGKGGKHSAKDDAAIRAGRAAIARVLRDKVDVQGAMTRDGVGPIDFRYGDASKGIFHVAQKHGRAAADAIPTVIAKGRVKVYDIKRGRKRATFTLAGREVHVAMDGGAENWVLTAYLPQSVREVNRRRTAVAKASPLFREASLRSDRLGLSPGSVGAAVPLDNVDLPPAANKVVKMADILADLARAAIAKALGKPPAGKGPTRFPPGSAKGGQFAPKGQGGGYKSIMGDPPVKPKGGSAPAKGGPKPDHDPYASKHGFSSESFSAKYPKIGALYAGQKPQKGDPGPFAGESNAPPKPAPGSPEWKAKNPGAKVHPQKGEDGGDVWVKSPHTATDAKTWTNPAATATFVPGGKAPAALNGVPMKPWADAPKDAAGWARVGGQNPNLNEPPLDLVAGKKAGAGVIIEEPDGRVWVVHPTNQFGGYKCVPQSDTQILTRDGWKWHDQIKPGDETIGFDPVTGGTRWTAITQVHRYDTAPMIRFGGDKWAVRCTPNHRWLIEGHPERGTASNPRRRNETRIGETKWAFGEAADGLGQDRRLVLSAPFAGAAEADITEYEAALIAWIVTDGTLKVSRHGKVSTAVIVQGKPEGVAALDALLSETEHSKGDRRSYTGCFEFTLSSRAWKGLLDRTGWDGRKASVPALVLRMGPLALRAFSDAAWMAEGDQTRRQRLYQNDGPIQDAIALAGYLIGHAPQVTGTKKCKAIGLNRPTIRRKGIRVGPARNEPAWCVTTDLGTWTMRQGGVVCLTGNSTYPKGTAEDAIPSLQANAIKEAFEESGLRVRIKDHFGDVERTTSTARYYWAERIGGTPTAAGWETQAVSLVPKADLLKHLNMAPDKDIAADVQAMGIRPLRKSAALLMRARRLIARAAAEKSAHAIYKAFGGPAGGAKGSSGGAWSTQPRWPGGTPLGGQWKTMGATGFTSPPKIGSATNATYSKTADALFAAANKGEVSTLTASAAFLGAKVTAASAKAKQNSHDKWNAQLHQYANALVDEVKAKAAAGTLAGASTAPAPAPTAKAPTKQALPDQFDLKDDLTYHKVKPGGSAKGAIYIDANGEKWLVKGYGKPDMAANEVLASKLYQAAGIGAPEMKLVDLKGEHGGGIGVASKWVDEKFSDLDPKDAGHLAATQKGFAVDAWTANWDAVGLNFDNTVVTAKGDAVRVDPGGALLYRAMGDPKGKDFGNTVGELDTMRDPNGKNPTAAAVFGKMTNSQIAASIDLVKNVDDATIKSLVDKFGPGDAAGKAALAEKLIARKADLVAKQAALDPVTYGAPAPATVTAAPAPKPAPVAPAVTLAIPPALPAKPSASVMSSASNANTKMLAHLDAIEKASVGFANGTLTQAEAMAQVQAFKFGSNTYGKKAAKYQGDVLAAIGGTAPGTVPVKAPSSPSAPAAIATKAKPAPAPKLDPDRLTKPPSFNNWNGSGKPLSSKQANNDDNQAHVDQIFAMAQKFDLAKLKAFAPTTPSKHVASYLQQAIEDVNIALNPPKPLTAIRMPGGGKLTDTINVISAKTPPLKNPSQVQAKVSYYPVLGKVDDVGSLAVPHTAKYGAGLTTETYAAQSKAGFAKLSPSEKAAIKKYTGSGYDEMNSSFRAGSPTAEAKLADAAIRKAMVDIKPGTVISRKINMDTQAKAAFLKSAEGKVIQEFGISSTSINPGVWSGQVHLRMVAGQGVKGLYAGENNTGSAISNHPGEKEVLFPANMRMVVLKVHPPGKGTADGFGQSGIPVVDVLILPNDK